MSHGFKDGDEVVLIKAYKFDGNRSRLVPVGSRGKILGEYLDPKYGYANSVVVDWDHHRSAGNWIDVDCIELVSKPVTDAELAEVYEILGVATKTEEV